MKFPHYFTRLKRRFVLWRNRKELLRRKTIIYYKKLADIFAEDHILNLNIINEVFNLNANVNQDKDIIANEMKEMIDKIM